MSKNIIIKIFRVLAFLTFAKEAMLHPNSGLVLRTMYNNMAKAISKYTIEGIQ